MAITSDDLHDFQQFAYARLSCGDAKSLVELAGQWEAQRRTTHQRELEETLADIEASHADIEAGRAIPLSDAFAEVRQQLGLQ
jgi:hypothetical protein